MKTALIVMTLMGCDCDAQVCEYIRTADAGWASVENCRADLDTQIRQNTGAGFPLITATCAAKAVPEATIARTLKVPMPEGDRPLESLARGRPVELPIAAAANRDRDYGYRMIIAPFTRAYDSTASAAGWAGGWVRHYAVLED